MNLQVVVSFCLSLSVTGGQVTCFDDQHRTDASQATSWDEAFGNQSNLMTVYLPQGGWMGRRGPIFLEAHGGGMMHGNRANSLVITWANAMVGSGFAAASIGYRLHHDDMGIMETYMESAGDFSAAIRHVKANGKRWGIDGNKIAIGGASAGAMLALLTAYVDFEGGPQHNNGGEDYMISDHVRAVAAMSGSLKHGPSDMTEPGHGFPYSKAALSLIQGNIDPWTHLADVDALAVAASGAGIKVHRETILGGMHEPVALFVNPDPQKGVRTCCSSTHPEVPCPAAPCDFVCHNHIPGCLTGQGPDFQGANYADTSNPFTDYHDTRDIPNYFRNWMHWLANDALKLTQSSCSSNKRQLNEDLFV